MDICRNILIVIFLFSFTFSYSQSIDAIKKKNEKTEKEIAYLNKLLENARKDKSSTIQKVSIINQKISKGKEMIQSLMNEVNYLDGQIKKNESVKYGLESDKQRMLEFYSKMVYETWKKRNESDKLIYIFSSSSFAQAYARYKYFEQVQDYSKRQIQLIEQTNDSLTAINRELSKLIILKSETQSKITSQNNQLIREQNEANTYIADLKKKEKELLRKLNIEIKNRERFKKELEKLQREMKNPGFTIVPVRLFINEKGLAKLVVALAKGKKEYDKRESIKEKDDRRDMARMFKR